MCALYLYMSRKISNFIVLIKAYKVIENKTFGSVFAQLHGAGSRKILASVPLERREARLPLLRQLRQTISLCRRALQMRTLQKAVLVYGRYGIPKYQTENANDSTRYLVPAGHALLLRHSAFRKPGYNV